VPFRIGLPELMVLLGIAILIFGGRKIPELGKGLGEGIRNFKASLHGGDDAKEKERASERERERERAVS